MNKPYSIVSLLLLMVALYIDTSDAAHGTLYCSRTANTLLSACYYDIAEEYLVKKAQCINFSESEDRRECREEMREDYAENYANCRAVNEARHDVCGQIGQARYDPEIDPANFVDPDDIGDSVAPNPYYPLVVGNRWVYQGAGETITVIVTDKTKLIDGVRVRVVNDVVVDEDGNLIEDTDDWFAQDVNGDIWYFGEIAENYELFDGDDPAEAELTDIDGSFKVGRDGAKAGLLLRFTPTVGEILRQEVAYVEAEDILEVVSITASETTPAASCVNNCMESLEYTPLEPGIVETKYYKPGVGFILEIDPEGERLELVEFSNTAP